MFREQAVLITGCSSGIGLATAREAARRGHRVFASVRSPPSAAALETLPNTRVLRLDVAEPGAAPRAVGEVLAACGRLDALVNNAGYAQYGAVEDVSAEKWRRQFEVNVFGALELVRAALPPMRDARHGTIVNVSSVAGRVAIPFAGPYCSAKHALEAMSDALRVETAPFGIRVVVVEPGPIESNFTPRARALVEELLRGSGPYSPFYAGAEEAMAGEFQRGVRPAETVARVIVRAIEAEKPRTRYRVGAMAKLFLPMRRLLPDRFFDRRFRKVLKLPAKI